MLMLTRKPGTTAKSMIYIGDDITVTVTQIVKGNVRLAIQAPQHVHVLRADAIKQTKRDESVT